MACWEYDWVKGQCPLLQNCINFLLIIMLNRSPYDIGCTYVYNITDTGIFLIWVSRLRAFRQAFIMHINAWQPALSRETQTSTKMRDSNDLFDITLMVTIEIQQDTQHKNRCICYCIARNFCLEFNFIAFVEAIFLTKFNSWLIFFHKPEV